MSSEYLCNLVIPGAAKSGTSSLHEYLGAHPLISMSSSKEPHHFVLNSRYAEGASAHNSLFKNKPSARYFGESSTGYLPWLVAAERISQDLDNPKAIIILRHPVARCFSHYRWRYRLGLEKRSFLQAVKQDGFGYNPENPAKYGYMAYLEFSQYARQAAMWEKYLGPDNCLFLTSGGLLDERQEVLERCFSFLGLPPFNKVINGGKLNETAGLSRRPSKMMTRIAGVLPAEMKASSAYKRMKDKLLKAAAPQPPSKMTHQEQAFVEGVLAEDIAWYEARFSKQRRDG